MLREINKEFRQQRISILSKDYQDIDFLPFKVQNLIYHKNQNNRYTYDLFKSKNNKAMNICKIKFESSEQDLFRIH